VPTKHLPLHGRHWRERALRYIPTVVIEWPFELMMALAGLVAGPGVALGVTSQRAYGAYLPRWIDVLLGVCLLLGGLTLAVGLVRGRYRTTVPRGLRLMGCAALSFAVVIALGGLSTLPSLPFAVVVGLLCLTRAFLLTTQWQMAGRIKYTVDRQ
jgi:hypothetical protein